MMDEPEPASEHVLGQIKRDLDGFVLGPELQENMQQHYRNLETLTASLKTIGADGEVIDSHVLEIFNQYKEAMFENIERLGRGRLLTGVPDKESQ
jgi:hypothetical protein